MKILPKLTVAVAALAMASCSRTVYLPAESVRTERVESKAETATADSVSDRSIVYAKGDTLIIYRDRVRWRERTMRDTFTLVRRDTVRQPYPVEVEKPLTAWQRTKLDWGGWAMAALAAIAAAAAIKSRLKG